MRRRHAILIFVSLVFLAAAWLLLRLGQVADCAHIAATDAPKKQSAITCSRSSSFGTAFRCVSSASDGRTPHQSRGTLEVVRSGGNANSTEDTLLANNVIDLMVPAFQQYDSAANKRISVVYDTSVASDTNLGNTAAYHPIRAAYCEVDFIDFGANTAVLTDDAVDILLNTGANAGAVRSAVANAMRDGILLNLRNQP